jgi:misacylated tRNA(Ala) deacylase
MQTKLLCLDDAYLKECDATVTAAEGDLVQLDQTVFYPAGGGVPCDFGAMTKDGAAAKVIDVSKKDGMVFHKIEGGAPPFAVGDKVHCAIDWERRHKLIRMHTSAHLLGALMYKRGALVTGNQLGVDQTRFDFNCPTGLQREMFDEAVKELNEILVQDVAVKIYSLPREEAFKIEGIVKLANKLPPAVDVLRIVQIGDYDTQADGGPHVRNVNEIGQVKIERIENKGTANKRLYYSLSP